MAAPASDPDERQVSAAPAPTANTQARRLPPSIGPTPPASRVQRRASQPHRPAMSCRFPARRRSGTAGRARRSRRRDSMRVQQSLAPARRSCGWSSPGQWLRDSIARTPLVRGSGPRRLDILALPAMLQDSRFRSGTTPLGTPYLHRPVRINSPCYGARFQYS